MARVAVSSIEKFIVSDWGDKIGYGIGLSYRPASLHSRLAGRYYNPMPVDGLYCKEANPMSGVFQNIDPHPLTARRVCTPPAFGGGVDTIDGCRGGGGVNSLENARHCSVLYCM